MGSSIGAETSMSLLSASGMKTLLMFTPTTLQFVRVALQDSVKPGLNEFFEIETKKILYLRIN